MFSVNNSVQCKQLCTTQDQNKEKYKLQRLFAEHKARISMQKFLLHSPEMGYYSETG